MPEWFLLIMTIIQRFLDENANDRRWNESGGMVEIHSDYDWYCVISKKYMDDASYTDLDKRIIPVIRLSEMHYIRGEYLAENRSCKWSIGVRNCCNK